MTDNVTMKPVGREWVGETSYYAVGAKYKTDIGKLAVIPTIFPGDDHVTKCEPCYD